MPERGWRSDVASSTANISVVGVLSPCQSLSNLVPVFTKNPTLRTVFIDKLSDLRTFPPLLRGLVLTQVFAKPFVWTRTRWLNTDYCHGIAHEQGPKFEQDWRAQFCDY